MKNAILFQIALRNLIQARRRTGVLFIAVATVTGMLVLLQAMSQGINDNLVTAATTLSAGQINVAGFFKATPGSGHVFAHTIANDRPHPLNEAFSIDRFHSGHLIDEHGAAAVAH